MKTAVLRALNIEKGEENLVFLILLQSFFLGTYMATFDIGANSLFLSTFGEGDLGKAYAVSAAIGMVLTYIYTKLQSRINFSILAISNIIFITIVTILMRLGFVTNPEMSKTIIYLIFILQGPLNTLAIVGFWGLVGRLFTIRQGKRLFGMVDSGQIFGMIIISFSVPLLLAFLPTTQDILLISAIGSTLALVFQFVLSSKYGYILSGQSEQDNATKADDKSNQEISFAKMLQNPYILSMIVFVLMAMLSQFFVHYSFLIVSKSKYPETKDFAAFFSIFMGMLMIFTFVFKTFVYSKLMQMYGLRINLLILPFLLMFFTAIASLSGAIMGFQPESGGFMMFFLFIAISKLFAQSLRSAIEVPAFKLLYMPLDKSIQYDVQAKVDGTVNEFSALIGGLALMGLGFLPFVTLIHFSYALVGIVALYIFISFKIYGRYRETLRETLNSFKKKLSGSTVVKNIREILIQNSSSSNNEEAIASMEILKNTEPIYYEDVLKSALRSSDNGIRAFALNEIGKMGLTYFNDDVKNTNTGVSTSDLAKSVIERLEVSDINASAQDINRYLRSKNPYSRILLINEIVRQGSHNNISAIAELLKDPDPVVKKAAIASVSKLKERSLWNPVMESLNDPTFRNVATATLLEIGEEMLIPLDLVFYKSSFNTKTLLHIIKIYEKTGSPKAVPLLIKKLNYPDLQVVNSALSALRKFNFHAQSSEAVKVQQAIEGNIGIALWNLVAWDEAIKFNLPEFLIKAIEEEVKQSQEIIYDLLSLLYDPQSISNIRQNIESGTSEGIGFAIELMDLFVAEELKPKLFPLFDDITLDDKIMKLEIFYPIERHEKEQLLIKLINRDFNQINAWTKSCALYTQLLEESVKIENDHIAQLFNPNPLLHELAAWLIYKNSRPDFERILMRVNSQQRQSIKQLIDEKTRHNSLLYFEKGLLLQSNEWFKNLKGEVLANISLHLEKVDENEKPANYLLAVVGSGTASVEVNNNIHKLQKGDVFSSLISRDKIKVSAENAEIYELPSYTFYDVFTTYEGFSAIVINMIGHYFKTNEHVLQQ